MHRRRAAELLLILGAYRFHQCHIITTAEIQQQQQENFLLMTTTIIINTLAINVDECLTSRRMLKSACVYILKSTSRRLIMIDLKLHDDSVDDDVSH